MRSARRRSPAGGLRPRRRVRPLAVAAILFVVLAVGGVLCWWTMIRMPLESYAGVLPPVSAREEAMAVELRAHVDVLARDIGERNVWKPASFDEAAAYVERHLAAAGLDSRRLPYDANGHAATNVQGTLPGRSRPAEILIIGAHYDSVQGTVGANDNASGVAALLALARAISGTPCERTVRFVAFANEEPPFFQTDFMGSLVYARDCRTRGDDIVAMISLETIGFYADDAGSQSYPPPLGLAYPSRGNFITFVGNFGSRGLVRDALAAFRSTTLFPSEGGALPGIIPGVGWSDHWAFWKAGYRAFMVTDTAPFRYPHYHRRSDTPEKLDYERMARVLSGIEHVVRFLGNR
jgi:hypothetical protein